MTADDASQARWVSNPAFSTLRLSLALAIGGGETERDTGRAISEENVETVRRAMEVANRRDVDALDDNATVDYEWHNASACPAEASTGDSKWSRRTCAITSRPGRPTRSKRSACSTSPKSRQPSVVHCSLVVGPVV